jgi:GMP synthase-like glutamine amidotransferase
MRPWCVVQHVAWEGPGLIAAAARARGLDLRVHRMDLGDPLPAADTLGGLVVMGGPMGAGDTIAYPHLAAERDLLAAAVSKGLPVLGVCLGAQLLASALGARVYRGPALEIGIGDVQLTEEGRRDAVLGKAGPSFPAVHWHKDTFDLPPECVHLASSPPYPHQGYRLGDRVYGFQFHSELDAGLLRSWMPHFPEETLIDEVARARVARAGGPLFGRFFDKALAAVRS